MENKLTGETYDVNGDEFAVESAEFTVGLSQFKSAAINLADDTLTARYEGESMTVEVAWTLQRNRHFAEKRMTLACRHDCGLKKVILSQPAFSAQGLEMVAYRYPQFGRPPGTEPICTRRPTGRARNRLRSVLSSCRSPNQLYYLPTKTSVPDQDKAEIRKWLDWGREHRVSPGPPRSARLAGSGQSMAGALVGDGDWYSYSIQMPSHCPASRPHADSIGFKAEGTFSITQEYPVSDCVQTVRSGETLRWNVPAQTAVVLRIQKSENQ